MAKFSLEELRLDPTKLPAPTPGTGTAPVTRRRMNRDFVIVTRAQSEQLNKTKHFASERVFRHLLFQSFRVNGRTGNKPVRVANAAMARVGVDRKAKWRALRELDQLGLVRVTWRARKSPEVVIVATGERGAEDNGTR